MAQLKEFFTSDHRACDNAYAALESVAQGGNADQVAECWRRFKGAMNCHLAMEEEVLFPEFDAAIGMHGAGPTAVMKMEHDQMRGVMSQMEQCVEDGEYEDMLDHGDTLLMLIQQHNVKEEGILYSMAQQHLSHKWDEIAARLHEYSID